ncbi:MAG: hypothetical protein WC554_17110 [Clostridia bacterium]|jgi:hypothetical protein
MTARSSRPRVTKKFYFDCDKKIHYSFETWSGGSVSGMKVAAKRHAETQPDRPDGKYIFLEVRFLDGKYIIKNSNLV